MAVDRANTSYTAMARRLSYSIKQHHPDAVTCLVTDKAADVSGFDFVRILPYGDLGGFQNDWQVYHVSPFRETIKLEADMLVVSAIDHWWTMLRNRDVVISTGVRDFYDEISSSRHYRRIFDANDLPDVYNAVTYWRLSQTAHDFWQQVRTIFENWSVYRTLLKFSPHEPDTDLVYAMSAKILGHERVTMPFVSYPRITHMKKHIIQTCSDDWTQDLVCENLSSVLRINTISQWGCFHYHVKSWDADA